MICHYIQLFRENTRLPICEDVHRNGIPIRVDIRLEIEGPQQIHGVEILSEVSICHEKSESNRTIEFWARYMPGQILCKKLKFQKRKRGAKGKFTRPKPKGKVGFKSLPSMPGFVPFSDNRYRSGIKSSGLSKSARG
jgi:hypothetical protein